MSRITARIIDTGPFTAKEAQVLRLMCEGLHGPEIALRLFRSPRTIDKHRENIAGKLNAHGSCEIVLIARKMGFVEITLSHTNHHILKLILMLFVCNAFFPQKDMRRPPRARTSSVRLIRLHRQH